MAYSTPKFDYQFFETPCTHTHTHTYTHIYILAFVISLHIVAKLHPIFMNNTLAPAKQEQELQYIINCITNKTPAKAFTPPAEKKKGHKVVFLQKSKRVPGLYLKAPNPHSSQWNLSKFVILKHSG